ncbi:MAG: hypothetical protein PHC48_05320 [Prevotella sp.]|nr:hypothetical protein [Prevotella sp.]
MFQAFHILSSAPSVTPARSNVPIRMVDLRHLRNLREKTSHHLQTTRMQINTFRSFGHADLADYADVC